ncbi:MAG: hypothetical protein FJZ01_25045 [Candidatus Sericytochromatia bacterium]|nr:hypothetical protein [Candidatus Tanganyikabacteria bacterium]
MQKDASGAWDLVPASPAEGADAWKPSTTQANFGSRAVTYSAADVIVKETSFGQATIATKEAISLVGASRPVLIVFAGFLVTGPATDRTALQVEASPDLGFTWAALTPTGAATSSLDGPTKLAASAANLWKRYEYSLAGYAGGSVRLRIGLAASANSRKLAFVDDVLVAEK